MNLDSKTWFYDELASLFRKKDEEDKARLKKMQRQVDAKFGIANTKSFVFSHVSPSFGEVIEIPFRCPDFYKPYAEMDLDNFTGAIQFRRNFARAHPFLIGPATLESLLDKPVDNYDYITTGKLPFNPLFFEFAENVSATIPHVKRSEVSLQGVYLCGNNKSGSMNYVFTSFWKDKEGEIMSIDLFMSDPRSKFFRGQVNHLSRSNFDLDNQKLDKNRYQFIIDINKDRLWIAQSAKKEAALGHALYRKATELVDFNELFDKEVSLSSVPHSAIDIVPSLSTNLINYINAHNMTIATRNRPGTPTYHPERPVETKPYSFVEVRDESYDEPKNHHKGQILTYQLAVRGHNRKLRDENMQIKKIIWIAPYTKGPEGAPFYDTRHEVTAKKIWAEKALFANIY